MKSNELLKLFVTYETRGADTVKREWKELERDGERVEEGLDRLDERYHDVADSSVKSAKKQEGAFARIARAVGSVGKEAKQLGDTDATVSVGERGTAQTRRALSGVAGDRDELDGSTATVGVKESGVAKVLRALGSVGQARDNADGTATVGVEEQGASGAVGALTAVGRAAAAVDERDVDVPVDVDTGAAMGKLAAFTGVLVGVKAAASGMDAGLSAGGVRITALGGIAAAAASLFTPLLGGLATVGSLAASAGAGFGLIGVAAAVMAHKVRQGAPAFLELKRVFEESRTALLQAFTPAATALAKLSVQVLKFGQSYLPRLGAAAEANVEVLTNGIAEFMRILKQPIQNAAFNTVLEASAPIVENLVLAAGRLIAALLNVFAVATPSAIKLSGVIANIAQQTLKWSQSTAGVQGVKAAVQAAVPVFRALWGMVKQVGGALLAFGHQNAPAIAQAIRVVSGVLAGIIRGFSALTRVIGPVGIVLATLTPLFLGAVLIVGQLAAGIGGLVGAAVALWPALSAVATFLAGPWGLAIGAAVAGIVLLIRNWSGIKAALQPLVPVFNRVKSAIQNLGTVIKGLFTGNTGTEQFKKAFASLPGPIQSAIKRIVMAWRSLKTGFQQVWNQVRPILTAVANGIQKGIVTALRFLIPQVKQFVANFRRGFQQVKQAVLPVLTAVAGGIKKGLGAAFKFAVSQAKVVVDWFRQNWPLIKKTALTVFNAMKRELGAVVKNIAAGIRTVWEALTKWWQDNNKHLGAIVKAAWNTIKTIISTVIKVVLGVIKATMQAINGDWKGAWETIKGVLSTVWEAIKQLVKNALTIVKNLLQVAWNTIKQITSAAWEAVRTAISDKIDAARNRAREVVDQLKAGLKTAWEDIKSAASSAWEAISGAIWRPIETAYNKVKDFIDRILGAINSVLEKVGIDPIGGGGGVSSGTSNGKGNGGSGRGAMPVRVRRYAMGGYVDGSQDVFVVGDKGQEEYVVNPNRRDNLPVLQNAAAAMGQRVMPAPHRTRRGSTSAARRPNFAQRSGLFPPWRAFGAESVGPTMHTYIPEMRSFVDDANAEFDIYTNTYSNHPPGYEQPYYRERSTDFWAPGGRGSDLSTAMHEKTVPWTIDRLGGNLNWLISNGRMLTSQGWGKDTSGFNHYTHQHTTAFAKGPTASGGGSGANLKSKLFETAWNNLVQPIIDNLLKPLTSSDNLFFRFAGAAAQKIPDGIKQWALDKLESMGGDSGGGSGLSGTPAQNRALGEKMFPDSGLSGSFSDVDAIWTQESGWDHKAQNPSSSAFGIPQFLDSTWKQYGGKSYDAEGQIRKGYSYIGDRYHGSAAEARKFKEAKGWYEMGGLAIGPQLMGLGEGNDELMIPLGDRRVQTQVQSLFQIGQMRDEIAGLRASIERGIRVDSYGRSAEETIRDGYHNAPRRYGKSREARRDVANHQDRRAELETISGSGA